MYQTQPIPEIRTPLSRQRVLEAAVALADEGGLEVLTMRNLAQHLGVEAMSLYYHVENKAALLDGLVDVIVTEILDEVTTMDGPAPEDDWKAAMRQRILLARTVLLRHKWAAALIEQTTSMSVAIISYYEGVLEIFRKGGFSYDLAHHALHVLGSRALGFTQELFDPGEGSDDASQEMFQQMADQFPHLVAMLSEIVHEGPDTTIGWCDDQTEFEFGLDILLDGLDRHRQDS
ncbi:MAG: TetR/AcrR family transcriptional regulator C-terminal domain-containing protein [Acidimicrobiia bacterium]